MSQSFYALSSFVILGNCLGCTHDQQFKKEVTNNSSKYNILFLIADDQRADALGCSGNTYIHTPNIDKLAKTGVRFSNCYVMGGHTGAICAPSRAMLMSGKSLFHVYDNLDNVTTMPMYFGNFGYKTFGTGKWHNRVKSFEASFQEGENVFIGGMSDHNNVPCSALNSDGKLTEPLIKGFSTDLFADAAIEFIDKHCREYRNDPFFCYVSFSAPHDPRTPQDDYLTIYPEESIPLPGNFKKLHPFEFDDLNIRDETLAPWPRTPEIIQSSLAEYYALISHIDKRVGDIIEKLKAEDILKNTIIVYTADNGLAIGSHGLLGKQNLYEHSTKVPLVVSGPEIRKGEISDALVYLYDIFPTLSDLCGLPLPEDIDGKDLSAIIKGKSDGVRTSLYTAYRNTARAVRTDEWKLIRYPQRDFTQLFNLKNDPLEIVNLASIPEYQFKVNEMMNLLMDWHSFTNDTATLMPKTILPLHYDYTKLEQKPDIHQPEYILNKYFK